MKDIGFTYSETDASWKSDMVTLTGNTGLTISLKSYGRVVIKKQNGDALPAPKIRITNYGTRFEFTLRGETEGKIIQVFTSTEPNYIRYANF